MNRDRYEPPDSRVGAYDAVFDAPHPIDVTTSILIAMEHRTGSTLLSWGMWRTGRAGLPWEYLLPMRLGLFADRWGVPVPTLRGRLGRIKRRLTGGVDEYQRFRPDSYAAFARRLAAERATPNGVFAMKTAYPEFTILLDAGLDHTAFGGRPVWVRLRRHDVVRQAVSRALASSTRRYHSFQDATTPPAYDRDLVAHHHRRILEDRAGWSSFLDGRGIRPLDLWYEDLVTDWDGALAAVFAHAGIDPPDRWPAPGLEPVTTAVNEEWVARYNAGR